MGSLRYYIYFDSAKLFHFASNTKNFWVTKLSKRKKERSSNKSERGQSWMRTKLYDESNLSSYNIPEFGNQGSAITLQFLRSSSWLGFKPLRNICITDDRENAPFCRSHNTVFLFWFMTYHRISNESDTTSVTNGAETAYPSEAHESPPLNGVRVAQPFVFCVVQYWSFWPLSFFFSLVYGFWLPHSYFPTLIFNTFLVNLDA